MKLQVNSNDINKALKVIAQCTNPKDSANKSNVKITAGSGKFSMCSTNGQMSALVDIPATAVSGDGSFCVDAQMLSRICGNCAGDIAIEASDKDCTVKGAGRTKIPIVSARIPEVNKVNGNTVRMKASDLAKAFGSIAFSIASEKIGRVILTGVHLEVKDNVATIVTIDSIRMSLESFPCEGDDVSATIPGAFMKLLTSSVQSGDVDLSFSKSHVSAEADGILLNTVLLADSYPDYKRMIIRNFNTSVLVDKTEMLDVLKSASVATGNTIYLSVGEDTIKVKSNDPRVDFEALVACERRGNEIDIAFNREYITEIVSSIADDEVSINFTSDTGPCIVSAKGSDNIRLVLPLRIFTGVEA